jgi:hypothetical protein
VLIIQSWAAAAAIHHLGRYVSKTRLDPSTYYLYVLSGSGQPIRAKAAGFRRDPLRSRYYTADPRVAKSVADCGDRYVKHLLADALRVNIHGDIRSL